ncbi:hypothetical protein PAXRUDRAFT_830574 [Paxillus rubicundulus Ve08.2h10]|uniref:Terpene synthase n=1 Tax=Paxillus rubicundulus Ve08.2h10 TaxID=930991 RepID=A0A0D0DT84_9AGAM|nr:hypothetical protein PAXRUDRAFT_830574 [Paxillus rubicundulus Ve08.2h10]
MPQGLPQPSYWASSIRAMKPLRIANVSAARSFSKFNVLKSNENRLSWVGPLQQPSDRGSNTSLIHSARATIRRLLARCQIQYKVMPFNHGFYQDCCHVAVQRGYPVPCSETFSPLTYFSTGTIYGATASAFGTSGYCDTTRGMEGGEHDTRHAQRVWIALCTAYAVFIDSIPRDIMISRELDNLRAFNDRLMNGEKQGNTVLDALADLLRNAPRVFGGPVPANLATNSILDFITATIVEVETEDMQVSTRAKQYPNYLRVMSGGSLVYAVAAFPPDIPFKEYIQAIPELTLFIGAVNDVLSFYKEELDGESNTHIAMMADQKGISRLVALEEFADIAVDMHGRVISILEGSSRSDLGAGIGSWGPGDDNGVDNQEREGDAGVIPHVSRASEAFKHFAAGYFLFHLSAGRYRLMEVGL